MGLRFNRRIKVDKGATLNLGKKGASISTGVKGAKVTFGRGTRTTVGIPGTGVSYTHYHNKKKDNQDHYEYIENNVDNDTEYEKVILEVPEGVVVPKIGKSIYILLGATFVLLLLSSVNILFLLLALPCAIVNLINLLVNKSFKKNYYMKQAILKYRLFKFDKCKNYCNKVLALDPSNKSAMILLEIIGVEL